MKPVIESPRIVLPSLPAASTRPSTATCQRPVQVDERGAAVAGLGGGIDDDGLADRRQSSRPDADGLLPPAADIEMDLVGPTRVCRGIGLGDGVAQGSRPGGRRRRHGIVDDQHVRPVLPRLLADRDSGLDLAGVVFQHPVTAQFRAAGQVVRGGNIGAGQPAEGH